MRVTERDTALHEAPARYTRLMPGCGKCGRRLDIIANQVGRRDVCPHCCGRAARVHSLPPLRRDGREGVQRAVRRGPDDKESANFCELLPVGDGAERSGSASKERCSRRPRRCSRSSSTKASAGAAELEQPQPAAFDAGGSRRSPARSLLRRAHRVAALAALAQPRGVAIDGPFLRHPMSRIERPELAPEYQFVDSTWWPLGERMPL